MSIEFFVNFLLQEVIFTAGPLQGFLKKILEHCTRLVIGGWRTIGPAEPEAAARIDAGGG
jgi:hypothetical protein